MEHYLGWKDSSTGEQIIGSVSSTVSKARLRLLTLALSSVLLLFVGRSVQLQLVNGAAYQAQAQDNRFLTETIIPPRGMIFDRAGEALAWNEPTFLLTLVPRELPSGEEERTEILLAVAQMTGLQRTDLDLLLASTASNPGDEVAVLEDIPYESGIRLATQVLQTPGFTLRTKTKRLYHSSIPSLSHVLGYTGAMDAEEYQTLHDSGYRLIDEVGKTGIEKQYETALRGTVGALVYEVDAMGSKRSIVSQRQAQGSGNMVLSLDAAFQKFAEEQLTQTLARVGASRGSVVAMDPETGAIRALVSLPAFESNAFTGGIEAEAYEALLTDPDQPLFPRAIAGEFPSGSIFKPFVAYAALAEGIVGEHTSFLSTGGVRIGQWFFPDWKAGGHGVTDVRKAIAESVNTYFYIVGGGLDEVTGLGVERISQYAQRFGFGAPTGLDLPSEAEGFLPSKEWKQEAKGERWYVGDTYHYAIGQGDFLTSPLQMAVATSVIANGGYRFSPYLVESIDGPGASLVSREAPIPIEGRDEAALAIVRQGMRQTVTSGSARSLLALPEAVAAKTGTAQTPGDRPYHSWFTGFGPYEDPSLTLVVLVEEGGESSDAAVPLARALFDWWFWNNR